MIFEPRLLRAAEKDLKRLDPLTMRRVTTAITERSRDEERPHTALTGQFQGLYRMRVGDYRVVYALDYEEQVLHVHFVRHRREVYR